MNAIFTSWASNPNVTTYLSWPRHESLTATSEFIRFSNTEWDAWPAGPYVIESNESGELIGSTGFGFCSTRDAEVGYVLAIDSWGRGYATEVLRALVDLAPLVGLEELHATIHPANIASSRVLQKCGFSCDAGASTAMVFPNISSATSVDAPVYSRAVAASPKP